MCIIVIAAMYIKKQSVKSDSPRVVMRSESCAVFRVNHNLQRFQGKAHMQKLVMIKQNGNIKFRTTFKLLV